MIVGRRTPGYPKCRTTQHTNDPARDNPVHSVVGLMGHHMIQLLSDKGMDTTEIFDLKIVTTDILLEGLSG